MVKKTAAVKLSLKDVGKLDTANGLDELAERLKTSNKEQYLLVRVFPLEDVHKRGADGVVTTVLISAIEPMIDPHDVNAAASLMAEATRLRLRGHGTQETLDLDGRDGDNQGKDVFDTL
jgi:hypothetical protein